MTGDRTVFYAGTTSGAALEGSTQALGKSGGKIIWVLAGV
jgi:hypothetical protein